MCSQGLLLATVLTIATACSDYRSCSYFDETTRATASPFDASLPTAAAVPSSVAPTHQQTLTNVIQDVSFSIATNQNEMTPSSIFQQLPSPTTQKTYSSVEPSMVQSSMDQPSPLVQQTSSPLVQQTSSPLVQQTSSPLVQQTSSPLVQQTSSPLVQQMSSVVSTLQTHPENRETPSSGNFVTSTHPQFASSPLAPSPSPLALSPSPLVPSPSLLALSPSLLVPSPSLLALSPSLLAPLPSPLAPSPSPLAPSSISPRRVKSSPSPLAPSPISPPLETESVVKSSSGPYLASPSLGLPTGLVQTTTQITSLQPQTATSGVYKTTPTSARSSTLSATPSAPPTLLPAPSIAVVLSLSSVVEIAANKKSQAIANLTCQLSNLLVIPHQFIIHMALTGVASRARRQALFTFSTVSFVVTMAIENSTITKLATQTLLIAGQRVTITSVGVSLYNPANISLAQGFDPGTLVGIVVGAAAGILLLVLVVTAISCYVWKEHTLRTYRIEMTENIPNTEDSKALEYKKEAATENYYQLDVQTDRNSSETQSYTVHTTV